MSPRQRLSKSLVGQSSSDESTPSPVTTLKRKRYSKNQWPPNSPPKSPSKPFSTKQMSQLISQHINQPQQSHYQAKLKKQKLVSKSGSCITSGSAIEQLQEEKASKEREAEERAEKKAKAQEAKLRAQQMAQVKRMNKARKICHLCQTHQTLKNKLGWITCFDCSCWCCYDCLPQAFKGACVFTTYSCFGCSLED